MDQQKEFCQVLIEPRESCLSHFLSHSRRPKDAGIEQDRTEKMEGWGFPPLVTPSIQRRRVPLLSSFFVKKPLLRTVTVIQRCMVRTLTPLCSPKWISWPRWPLQSATRTVFSIHFYHYHSITYFFPFLPNLHSPLPLSRLSSAILTPL